MAEDVAGEREEAGHAQQEVLRGIERHLPPVLERQTKVMRRFAKISLSRRRSPLEYVEPSPGCKRLYLRHF